MFDDIIVALLVLLKMHELIIPKYYVCTICVMHFVRLSIIFRIIVIN